MSRAFNGLREKGNQECPLESELQLGETGVEGIAGHQLGVRADVDDAAVIDDDDAVGLQHRGEAVGDDDGRAPLHQALERLLAKTRATTLLDVSVDDRQPVKALIREVQRNPLRPIDILHVDLYEVHADEEIAVDVPIKFVGTADGVKNAGGVFEAVLHQLQIRVLPGDIPDHIEVDVSPLGLGQSIHVSDLTLAKGEFLTDGGVTLCTVVAPKTEAATEGAEGGAEPELIRKPKPAEDEANAKG